MYFYPSYPDQQKVCKHFTHKLYSRWKTYAALLHDYYSMTRLSAYQLITVTEPATRPG